MQNMLKTGIAVLALSTLASLAQAAPGTYAGLGLGYSYQDTTRNQTLAPNNLSYSTERNKLGARIFAGQRINENFGVEMGLAQYANVKYKASTEGSLEYSMQALDLVGKAYLPVGDGFNVYALGGAALVRAKTKSSVATSYSHTQNKVRPIVGAGVSYDIPQSPWTTSFEVTRIQGYGNTKSSNTAIPSANLATLNLSYNFG